MYGRMLVYPGCVGSVYTQGGTPLPYPGVVYTRRYTSPIPGCIYPGVPHTPPVYIPRCPSYPPVYNRNTSHNPPVYNRDTSHNPRVYKAVYLSYHGVY